MFCHCLIPRRIGFLFFFKLYLNYFQTSIYFSFGCDGSWVSVRKAHFFSAAGGRDNPAHVYSQTRKLLFLIDDGRGQLLGKQGDAIPE